MIRPRVAQQRHINGVGSTVPLGQATSNLRRQRKNLVGTNSKSATSLIVLVMVAAFAAMGVVSINMMYLTNSVESEQPTQNKKQPLHPGGGGGSKIEIPKSFAKDNDNNQREWVPSQQNPANLIQSIRDEFNERYGGSQVASEMLQRGIHSYGSVDATALRMVAASQAQRPFVIAFSGYSITVGRGNYFNQSFPFVTQRVLEKPFESLLSTKLVVRNGAIGGIPSFPYGFCLEHFLGKDVDVISWDYSMNESPKSSAVLESFVRQAMQQLPNRPMLIVLDTNPTRTSLLQDYAHRNLLHDAISVGKKEVIEKTLFEHNPLPKGLQQWDEFGAPKNCPGRGSWHPKKMEHELIGWMIAMHFTRVLERAVELLQPSKADELQRLQENHESQRALAVPADPMFPVPSSKIPQNPPKVTGLLYGHKITNSNNDENENIYRIKDVSCRTSFLPATDHKKVIPSIVVSGMSPGMLDMDIILERPDSMYEQGWVLDVSKVERDTKRKVEACGGLGYIDMKIAMYGIPGSGTLRLWLPYEKGPYHDHDHDSSDTVASHWFDNLVICEANEKRGAEACQLDHDLEILIGGVKVTNIEPIHGAAEYLKRTTCVVVSIPPEAPVTQLDHVKTTTGAPLTPEEKSAKFGDSVVGLLVDITVKPNVSRKSGACCLSHIVWEQH